MPIFMSNKEHATHMTRFENLRSILVQAHRAREFMPMQDTNTPYWNTYEMLTLWGAVNQFRNSEDKKLLPFEHIEQAERRAAGHIDYTRKFALYCAELILED